MALQVCREDLTKVQVELNRLQAEYSDVVPQRDWDNLNHMHEETLIKVWRKTCIICMYYVTYVLFIYYTTIQKFGVSVFLSVLLNNYVQ